MTQIVFDPKAPAPLTPREHNLLQTLRTHLTLEHQATFTVDTLRMLGFDRFMPKDSLDRINYGTLLLKWHVFGHIEPTGRFVPSQLESNHGHRVQEWRMK